MTAAVPKLRSSLKTKGPTLAVERSLWAAGVEHVVGIDEVGRGAWAGPLTVGAAVVPKDRRVYKIRDSKMLTEPEREALFDRIAAWCVSWAVGHASHRECDELGMADAQRLATRRALAQLTVEPGKAIVDGKWDFVDGLDTEMIVKGDAKALSISAASILAKVTRDRIMRSMSTDFPMYRFEMNKGYPGPFHRSSLHHFGPSTVHRKSWVFVDSLAWNGVHRFRRPEPQGQLFSPTDAVR